MQMSKDLGRNFDELWDEMYESEHLQDNDE